MANKNKADLFVSIHTDAAGGDNVTGFNIYVSSGNRNYPKCLQFGSAMIDALKGNTTIGNDLKQRDEGIWVLRRSDMPAILLLCGNIDDAKDLAFVSNNQNQEKIARDILQGIVGYESSVQDAKQ
jgi:N-acetylmuramoyl-L-alanine amidase